MLYIYNVKNNIINKIKQLVIDFDIFFFLLFCVPEF